MVESTISFITALAMLIGILMFFSARFFRTPEAPRGYKWNPREWTPIWKQGKWLHGPGFVLLMGGYALFSLAFLVRLYFLGWPC